MVAAPRAGQGAGLCNEKIKRDNGGLVLSRSCVTRGREAKGEEEGDKGRGRVAWGEEEGEGGRHGERKWEREGGKGRGGRRGREAR